jgi:hypothetical protein
MGSQITFINQTDKTVTFGLCNAANDHLMMQKVERDGGTEEQKMDHSGEARVVAAWINEDTIYPDDTKAFMECCYFKDGTDYKITLSTAEISISQADAAQPK